MQMKKNNSDVVEEKFLFLIARQEELNLVNKDVELQISDSDVEAEARSISEMEE